MVPRQNPRDASQLSSRESTNAVRLDSPAFSIARSILWCIVTGARRERLRLASFRFRTRSLIRRKSHFDGDIFSPRLLDDIGAVEPEFVFDPFRIPPPCDGEHMHHVERGPQV